MRINTLIGIIIGFIAIFGAFLLEGGDYNTLFMIPAMIIVFGGTLAAGFAGSGSGQMSKLPALVKVAFFSKKYDLESIINQIVFFSGIARREGVLSIESRLNEVKHPYLKKLFEISIDGTDPDTLQRIVENEMDYISERHEANIGLFNKLGGYSPTMGIIGTVMGLISTLAAAGGDPNELIHHIASAFIATMWGILMANIVWLPIADKLKVLHDEEIFIMTVMLEGVYSLQMGETPYIVRAKLISAFPLNKQAELLSVGIENDKGDGPETGNIG